MTVTALDRYRARFRKVLEYIDEHLGENLDVERLSGVAAFSKYHFHRQFTELFGLGVSRYIQLKRLKRASYRLAYRQNTPVVDIALESGYEGPEAFARAFRKIQGQSPSEFRKLPQWDSWYAAYQSLSELRIEHMSNENRADQVRIVEVQQRRVAELVHRGDHRRLGDSLRKFIEWRQQNGLPPRISATFNIFYDNPAEVPSQEHRLGLCAATDCEIGKNSAGVVATVIPGGRCAVLRHIGSDDNLETSVGYLYSQWLPQSGEELRDFPLYLQRVRFFPEVPEHEAIVDIFLPLK